MSAPQRLVHQPDDGCAGCPLQDRSEPDGDCLANPDAHLYPEHMPAWSDCPLRHGGVLVTRPRGEERYS